MENHICAAVPNRLPLFLPHGPRNSCEAAHDLQILISTMDAFALSPRLTVHTPWCHRGDCTWYRPFRPELLGAWHHHRPQFVDLLACCASEAEWRWSGDHRESNPRQKPYRAETWEAAINAYEEGDPGLQDANAIISWG
jgi:hypothetical protein